jgi:hypothetical protein
MRLAGRRYVSRAKRRTALLFVLAAIQWAWLLFAIPEVGANDFGIFYRSAAASDPYAGHAGDPTVATGDRFTNLNPPHFLLVIKPFTLLPLWLAGVIWWTLNACLLAAGLTWWLREQQDRWTPDHVAWALLWAPNVTLAFTGQVTAVLGVPLWLAYRSLSRGDNWRGGLYAGIVFSCKPILWPLVVWYATRRSWHAVGGVCLGAIAAVSCGVAVFGVDAYRAWIGALRGITWGSETMNASLPAVGSRLPFSTPALLWTAGGIAIALWTIWRMRNHTVCAAWMPLLAVSLLASPLGWVYYGAWLLPGTRAKTWMSGAALGWCAPMLIVSHLANMSAWSWSTVGSIYGFTLIGVWLAAVKPAAVANMARSSGDGEALDMYRDTIDFKPHGQFPHTV